MDPEPALKLSGTALDFELADLLGRKPSDFLVLLLNGERLDGFGTPWDTPRERELLATFVARLNDKSRRSLWPTLFENYRPGIVRQFGLAAAATAKDFHPVASFMVSRVVCGYSEHLHAAIRLFEELEERIDRWTVMTGRECCVEIVSRRGTTVSRSGIRASVAIAEAVRDLLRGEEGR